MRCIILAGVLTFGAVGHGHGQSDVLYTGQWVRITAPTLGLDAQAVTLRAVTFDSIYVVIGGDPRALPVSRVGRVEVRRLRRHTVEGLVIGAGIGGAIGVVAGIAGGESDCSRSFVCFTKGQGAAIFGGIGASVGAIVGILAGSSKKSYRWEAVPLGRVRMAVEPQRHGVGIGARIAF